MSARRWAAVGALASPSPRSGWPRRSRSSAALLSSHGLAAALSSAGLHAADPVTIRARGIRRCRPEVEIAVYFTCLAALDNAAKHAGPARVSVSLSDSGTP